MSYSDTRYTDQPAYGSDFTPALAHASAHHSGGNEDLFANALSFIQERAQSLGNDDIDEAHAVKSHQALYGGADGEVHDDRSVGAGAAMQALKMFMSGDGQGGGQGGGGGFDQNQLIGMAMAQAGKLWDQKQGEGATMVSFFSFLWGWVGFGLCWFILGGLKWGRVYSSFSVEGSRCLGIN